MDRPDLQGPLGHWREGSAAGPEIDPMGRLRKYELRVGNAESLQAMTAEYAFFTPAPLYIFGIVTDHPLLMFLQEYRQNVPFYFKKFTAPLFRGLEVDGDEDWNHALWAIRCEHWPVFVDFYCSIKVSNRQRKRLFGIGWQSLVVVDPVALERGRLLTSVPTLRVGAFGVDGNEVRIAFEPSLDPALCPPRLRFYEPDPVVEAFAQAHWVGADPHLAQELYRQRAMQWRSLDPHQAVAELRRRKEWL